MGNRGADHLTGGVWATRILCGVAVVSAVLTAVCAPSGYGPVAGVFALVCGVCVVSLAIEKIIQAIRS